MLKALRYWGLKRNIIDILISNRLNATLVRFDIYKMHLEYHAISH